MPLSKLIDEHIQIRSGFGKVIPRSNLNANVLRANKTKIFQMSIIWHVSMLGGNYKQHIYIANGKINVCITIHKLENTLYVTVWMTFFKHTLSRELVSWLSEDCVVVTSRRCLIFHRNAILRHQARFREFKISTIQETLYVHTSTDRFDLSVCALTW